MITCHIGTPCPIYTRCVKGCVTCIHMLVITYMCTHTRDVNSEWLVVNAETWDTISVSCLLVEIVRRCMSIVWNLGI